MEHKGSHVRYCSLFAMGLAFFFLPLGLSGCTAPTKRADQSTAYEKIAFSEILSSPGQYTGRVVRFGGVIIDTQNLEGETTMEILQKPLDWQGRPKSGDESAGRFVVVFDGFLDEAIYQPDRPITIVGEIVGTKTGPIGEVTYTYPLLSGKEARLWKKRGYYDWPRMHIGIGIGAGSGGTGGSIGIGTSF